MSRREQRSCTQGGIRTADTRFRSAFKGRIEGLSLDVARGALKATFVLKNGPF